MLLSLVQHHSLRAHSSPHIHILFANLTSQFPPFYVKKRFNLTQLCAIDVINDLDVKKTKFQFDANLFNLTPHLQLR